MRQTPWNAIAELTGLQQTVRPQHEALYVRDADLPQLRMSLAGLEASVERMPTKFQH